ncbi:AP-3 complex subunit beta [Hondaea fermentalgiana]|uniref:AP-3 complex subunit beta n=1 Tax=Hondaea fermentalgiana TaxID=2315210 RepID=A0A2R5GN16_9STRA|nr:AP-3 complex subunit beta [Hondaea fermentalgiana]|eukprot:GBG32287.1 AP-3 complex subunit beta [Hondaea fermentalgiana]
MVLSTGDSRFFEESVNAGRLRGLLAGRSHNAASGVQERTQAMKWLLAMVSKGRDVSQFFPDVVKNVVVRSVELKKLVYVYLMHYADHDATCRDLALLSINSFQKDLADGNPLIRGLALRTMTSIRVRDIVQLQIMAVQKCAGDSAIHVRKTAAHALPKIFSLDPGTSEELIALLVKLLADHSNIVVGSAVAAFQEICPGRFDIIHPIFRTLCSMLPDMEEWGQIVLIAVLTRYAREFFMRPTLLLVEPVRTGPTGAGAMTAAQASKTALQQTATPARKLPTARDLQSFYASDEEEDENETDAGEVNGEGGGTSRKSDGNNANMDTGDFSKEPSLSSAVSKAAKEAPQNNGDDNDDGQQTPVDRPLEADHRHMLKTCMPLLLSRNSAVVMSAVSMLWYCGKRSESAMAKIAAALVRLLHGPREVQYMALQAIVPIASEAPQFFHQHLDAFFVRTASDPSFVRVAKVDVLTILAYEANVDAVLNEFEVYLSHPDKPFVCSVVHAVGRLVNAMPHLADRCLRGLASLMTCPDESVVGEAVVVTRTVLQQHPDHANMVRHLVRMLDQTSIPSARASVVWIAAEFVHFVPDIAPEVLRKLALSFGEEAPMVKMQVVNLAVRLHMAFAQPERFGIQKHLDETTMKEIGGVVTGLLDYILELARFDASYDLRDRVRLLRAVLEQEDFEDIRADVLLASKPPPNLQMIESTIVVDPQARFVLDSLSHCAGHGAPGYRPLTDWPATKPNSALREPAASSSGYYAASNAANSSSEPRAAFYGDSSSSSGSDDESAASRSTGSRRLRNRASSVASSASSSSSGSSGSSSSSGSSGSSSSSSGSRSRSSSESSNDTEGGAKANTGNGESDDVLAMFDSYAPGRSGGADPIKAEPSALTSDGTSSAVEHHTGRQRRDSAGQKLLEPSALETDTRPRYTILGAVHGDGLRAEAVFTRRPSSYKKSMNEILVYVTNGRGQAMTGVRVTHMRLKDDQALIPFPEIATLPPGATEQVTMHVDFGGKAKTPIKFCLSNERGAFSASLSAPCGELLTPAPALLADPTAFAKKQAQLSGMHEAKREHGHGELVASLTYEELAERLFRAANVATSAFPDGVVAAAGRKLGSDGSDVTVVISLDSTHLRVGSDDFLLAATLCDDLVSGIFSQT